MGLISESGRKMMRFLLLIVFLASPALSIKCFSCISGMGGPECDETNLGEVAECERCLISNGFIEGFEFEFWQRSCATAEIDVGCDTTEYENGEYLSYCICEGDLCNESFETAGRD